MQHHHARHIVHLFEWLMYIGGFLLVILGVLFLSFQSALPILFPKVSMFAQLQGTFGSVAGMVLILWGAASFWIGHGFHHYHNNTRIAFLVLSVIVFVGAIAGGFSSSFQFWLFGVLAIVQVWLFGFQKEVIDHFRIHEAPKPAAKTQ